jgi:hypothetical protein
MRKYHITNPNPLLPEQSIWLEIVLCATTTKRPTRRVA